MMSARQALPDLTLLAQQDEEGEVLTATTDLAGSVTAMRDASGTVTAQYSYTAFGARTLTAGVDVTVIGYRSEQHGAAGLIYLRARYYDPATGQFISIDPLVAVTLDRYGYADGNPLQIVDPLGLFGWEDVGEIAGWIALAAAVGPLEPALKRLGEIARRPLPRNVKDAATAAEQQAFAQLGYVSPDIVGQLHGAARDVLATGCR